MSEVPEMILAHAKDELAFQASQANSQLFLGFQLTLLSLASPIAAAWWNALKTPHTTVSWHAMIATLMFLEGYGAAWVLAIVQMCHVRYRRIEAFAPDREVCRIAQEEGAARVPGLEQAAARDRAGELVADIVRLRLAARLREVTALHRRSNRERRNAQRLTAVAILIMTGGLILGISQGFPGSVTRAVGSII